MFFMPVENNCAYIPTCWYFSSAHGPMSFVGRPSSLTVMKYSRRFLANSRVPGSLALQCRPSLAEFRAILLHGKALLRRDVDHIRAPKACPDRSEGRKLGESASPEGLIASFKTRRDYRSRRLTTRRSGVGWSPAAPCVTSSLDVRMAIFDRAQRPSQTRRFPADPMPAWTARV